MDVSPTALWGKNVLPFSSPNHYVSWASKSSTSRARYYNLIHSIRRPVRRNFMSGSMMNGKSRCVEVLHYALPGRRL